MPLAHVFLAPGFEEVEAVSIIDVLRRAGVDVTTVSLAERAVTGAHGITLEADALFSDVQGQTADVAILPGGGPGTQFMQQHSGLHDSLKTHRNAGKLLAAVCAAPTVLAKTGLLNGVRATCFPGCEPVLLAHGATLEAYNVVTDNGITTSRGPATAAHFAIEVARQLVGEEAARAVAQAMLYQ
ncbi:DJ-1 family glyoxalase III [Chitinibacteraceae bacterium HSL-7]